MKSFIYILFLVFATVTFVSCGRENKDGIVIHNKSCIIEITGMMCEMGCKTTIQNRINELDGVIQGEVDYVLGKAFVTYDANRISAQDIIKTIVSIGDGALYGASLVEDKD